MFNEGLKMINSISINIEIIIAPMLKGEWIAYYYYSGWLIIERNDPKGFDYPKKRLDYLLYWKKKCEKQIENILGFGIKII